MNELTIPPWLVEPIRRTLVQGDRIPHAMLVHGQAGIGKRVFARLVARGVLCESPDEPRRLAGGCGVCAACVWFDQGNHPDFRRVTSEAVAAEEGIDTAGDESESDDADAPRGKKVPSREIKVEQIRALQRFLAVATHRSRHRVVLLYPLEALNTIGANALLKMLEEPPPRTLFLLVADRLGGVPPTILSRCCKSSVATPPAREALEWLRGQGVDDAAEVFALSGEAPFAALALARDADSLQAHRTLVRFLAAPDASGAMAAAEAFGRSGGGGVAPVVHGMQLWLSDCITMRLTHRLRYHPAQSRVLAELAGGAPLDGLLALNERLMQIRRTVDHPLNARLMLEGLFLAYVDALSARSGTPERRAEAIATR